MSGVELATAYVTLMPDASRIGPSVRRELGNAEGDARRSGKRMGDGMAAGVQGSMKGAVAGVGKMFAGLAGAMAVGDFFKGAIGEAREGQKVAALTESVIKSTGGAAKVTADQVAQLSGAISNKTGIDDEAIQSGANLLLTFKNIKNEAGTGNDIFSQTTSIMTDMATAMGQEPKAAAIQLGKALNDPIKGVAALGRVGVTFTEQQKNQIKTLVASGKTMDAQKLILTELKSEFGGAAEAQATAGDKAAVAWGNFQEEVGTLLLPLLDKLFTALSVGLGWLTDNLGPALAKVGEWFKPLASAWDDVVYAFQNGDAFSDSPVIAFFQEIAAKAGELFYQVGPALSRFGDFVKANVLPAVREFAAQFGPVLMSALRQVGGFVTGTVVPAWQKLAGIWTSTVLPIVGQLVNHFRTSMLPMLRQIGEIIVTRVVPAVMTFVQGFIANALPAIQRVAAFVRDTLVPNVLSLARTIGENVVPIVRSLADNFTTHVLPALSQLWNVITTKVVPVIVKVGEVIIPVIRWVAALAAKILGTVVPVILNFAGPVIGGLIKAIGWIVEKIAGFVGKLAGWGLAIAGFATGMWSAIMGAKDKIVQAWNLITGKFQSAKDWVVGAFSAAWSATKAKLTAPIDLARDGIRRAWDSITSKFTSAKDWVVGVFKRSWDGIKKIFTDPVDAAKTAISNILGATGLQSVFTKARDAIGRIWDGIRSKVAAPINGVIGIVNNPFVRGFNNILDAVPGVDWKIPTIPTIKLARGGVLPGYTPGRDVHDFFSPTAGRLSLSGGEAIMRPEFTRALGTAGVNALNLLARTRGVGGVRDALGGGHAFAKGGIWDKIKGVGSSVVHKIKETASAAFDYINPKKWLEKGANALLGLIPGGGFGDIAKGVLRKVIEGFAGKVEEASSGGGGAGGGPLGGAGGGMGWQWQWAQVKRQFPSAILTSAFRPGAVTAGYGWPSNHARGRAIDVAGPPGLMSQIASWLASKFGSKSLEIIYSGLWGNRSIWQGRWATVNPVTQRNHYDHVHWGFKDGGIPTFDNGGILAPGYNLVQNRLGKPEPLVRPEHVQGMSDRDIDRLAKALGREVRLGAFEGTSQRESRTAASARSMARLGG